MAERVCYTGLQGLNFVIDARMFGLTDACMLCAAVSSDVTLLFCCVDSDMDRNVCVRQEVPLTASATEVLEWPVAHVLQCTRLSRVCSSSEL